MNTLVVGWMLVTRRNVKSISGFRSKTRRIVIVAKRVVKIQSGVLTKLWSTSPLVKLEESFVSAMFVVSMVAFTATKKFIPWCSG